MATKKQTEKVSRNYDQNPNDIFDSSVLYNRWLITIQTRDKFFAGIPGNEKMIESWVRQALGLSPYDALTSSAINMVNEKKKQVQESRHFIETQRLTSEGSEELSTALEAVADEVASNTSATIFLRDEKGLYYETRCVKSMFKEVFSLLGYFQDKRGSKQIIQHGTFRIMPVSWKRRLGKPDDRIYLNRQQPDGIEEKPIQVMTPQGPRTAIKRGEYLVAPTISFELWLQKIQPRETRYISERDLIVALTSAQENGLGSQRSQGAGTFDVLKVERISVEGSDPGIIYQLSQEEAA